MLRLLITLGLALPLVAAEPMWQVRTWVTDDGLPNNDVPCVTQHPDGAMLFATHGGLVRFDGLRFHPVEIRNSRGGGGVGAVLPQSDGSLWMVTNSVLARLDPVQGETVLTMPVLDLPGSRETAFFEQPAGTLWLCFEGGRFHRIQGNRIEQVPVAPGLSPTFAACATSDRNGLIWASGPTVLAKWQNDRFEPVAELPKNRCVLTRAAAGGVWIGAGRRLLHYTEQAGLQIIAEISGLPEGARLTRLYEDRNGRLWLGSFGGGLWLRQGDHIQSIPLPHPDVWWLSEDREGNLWVATGGGGVCRVRPRLLTMLEESTGPRGEVARAICATRSGDLWVATQNGKLFTRCAGQWREFAPGTGWPAKKAVRVNAGNSDDIWIGDGNGDLVHWDGTNFETIPLPDRKPKLAIVSVLQSRSGDLWVGRGFNVWRRHGAEWRDVPLVAESGEAVSLAEDRGGCIWAGTARGMLLREDGGRFVRIAAESLDCLAIRSLLVMPDGALLIATQGSGIVRYANGRCAVIGRSQGLPHRTVSQLALDGRGRIWAGSDAGLFMVPYEQVVAIAENRSASLHATVFGRSEGLTGLQANASFPGALIERDGTFWCSTRSGLARIDTAQVGLNAVPPRATIESILINDGTPVSAGGCSGFSLPNAGTGFFTATPVKLPPGIHNLAFEFGTSSFAAPESIRIRYQLLGIDQKPHLADAGRHAVYGRMPPGDYTLRVSAANNDGVWSKHDTVLNLRIAPIYHETSWFRALGVLAAVGLVIVAGYRIALTRYHRRTEALRRETAVHAERTRIARDMHDQIGASLTQISLLSDIAVAQGNGSTQLDRLAATARETAQALDEIVWAIDPGQDRFNSLLEYLAPQITELSQAANLRCRFDFPAQTIERYLPAAHRHQLFLIVREAVHNIIQHASATELKLRIATTATDLLIEVTDNGAGFHPTTTNGHGLQNMRTRTESLGGTFSIRSQPGTAVTLRIPWPSNPFEP